MASSPAGAMFSIVPPAATTTLAADNVMRQGQHLTIHNLTRENMVKNHNFHPVPSVTLKRHHPQSNPKNVRYNANNLIQQRQHQYPLVRQSSTGSMSSSCSSDSSSSSSCNSSSSGSSSGGGYGGSGGGCGSSGSSSSCSSSYCTTSSDDSHVDGWSLPTVPENEMMPRDDDSLSSSGGSGAGSLFGEDDSFW